MVTVSSLKVTALTHYQRKRKKAGGSIILACACCGYIQLSYRLINVAKN